MPSCGVVYVATNEDRYIEEAFLSAESLKRLTPNVSITLFTDRAHHALCRAGVFSDVQEIVPEGGFRSSWADGQLTRLRCLPKSPYDNTLNLDTDTRVFTSDVPRLFQLLDELDVAMVEDRADYSMAAKLSKLRMFNAGFILYRRAPSVLRWLERWTQATIRNFRLAMEEALPEVPLLAHLGDSEKVRHLLSIDQIALVEILSPTTNQLGLKLGVLERFWNYRGPLAGDDTQDKVRIVHSDEIRGYTRPDLLTIAYDWAARGDPGAELLYEYVASFQPQHYRRRSWFSSRIRPAPRAEWATPGLKRADLHLLYGQTDKAVAFLAKETRAEMLSGVARAELIHERRDDALALARSAQSHDPRSPYTNLVLGQILHAADRPLEAIPPLVVAARGGAPGAYFLLGQSWFNLGNYSRATDAYERAVEEGTPGARNNLMISLVGQGQYEKALFHADAILRSEHWHVPALAFKGVALAELGRSVENLFDHHAFCRCASLPVPPGYKDLETFNAAVGREIMEEKSLAYEPRGNATRFGRHSGDLAQSTSTAIQALNHALLGVAQERMETLARSCHPFSRAVPRLYRLYAWAVVMDRGGHQTPHIHSNGWLSGVYYVEVPDEVQTDDPGQNGWLEFGQSEDRWHRKGRLPRLAVLPKPGLVVTFPSYFWHNTRPLISNKRRISFAFDIVPV